MKKILTAIILVSSVVVLASLTNEERSNCSGEWGQRKSAGPPSCYAGEAPQFNTCNSSGCHTDYTLNSGTASLHLDLGGMDSTYNPGQTYTITVSLVKTGIVRGGFQFVAIKDSDPNTSPGTITLTDQIRTQVVDAAHPHTGPCPTANKVWVEHTASGIDDITGDSIFWQFNWQAPATDTGTVTFYVASVDADKDLDNTGDYVYSTHKTVRSTYMVTDTTDTTTAIDPIQYLGGVSIYPVPFGDQIQVKPQGNATYTYYIMDMAGKPIQTGSVSTTSPAIDTRAIAPGMYLLQLKSTKGVSVKKILKL